MLSLQVVLGSVKLTVKADHHSFLENDKKLNFSIDLSRHLSANSVGLRLMLTLRDVSDTHLIRELTICQ